MPKVIVSHAWYGCETGCCGHVIDVDGIRTGEFFFNHPYCSDATPEHIKDSLYREFAEKLVKQVLGEDHVKDLDWENCYIVDD